MSLTKVFVCFLVVLTALSAPVFSQTVSVDSSQQEYLSQTAGKYEKRVNQEYGNMVANYRNLPDSDHGRILGSDIALELFPEYLANQAISESLRPAAQVFIMRLYADQLSRPAQPGSSVVFSAGGTGAGKTTALNMFSYLIQNAEIVMDTTMSDYYWSTKLIDQALNSGRRVTVMYVYRDPVDAFANGVLPRAMRIGRLVGFDYHIKSHIHARKVMDQLMLHYAAEPNFQLIAVDNSRGLNEQRFVALSTIPAGDPVMLKSRIKGALYQALSNGTIDQKMYDTILIAR